MDAFSEVLKALRLESGIFLEAEFTAPWCIDPAPGTDSVAIRNRSYFSLGYDHRLVDGADAARFLARLKETLESFPSDA